MGTRDRVHIGTSGWHYKHWIGIFYPPGFSGGAMLGFYSERFHTVEINNSFYRLPEEKTVRDWKNATPSGFVFSVKASRYITHMKKLKDPEAPVCNVLHRMGALGGKLGPILFQLPGRWALNLERLESFLSILPQGQRYAFEFRDPSWFDPRAYQALSRHGAAFCIHDFNDHPSPKQVTAEFVYIRLHGPGTPYAGQYSTETLGQWADAISTWAGEGKEVYCYFNNDNRGYAAQDAARLREMIDGRPRR